MRRVGPWIVAMFACRGDVRDHGHEMPPPVRPPTVPTETSTPPPPDPDSTPSCEAVPFEATTPVPEASGAAWMTIDGKPMLVVIGDSGNHGAYALVDPDTGRTGERGKLPLGGGGDDLEGAAIRDGKLVALSSAGWIRVWERTANGFALIEGPYPLAAVELPDDDPPPHGSTGMVCPERHSNCGRNYEGLCLAPNPSSPRDGTRPCVGFAASKYDGSLYCLVDRGGKLAIDRDRSIHIAKRGRLADCAFSDTGELVTGNNLFGHSRVYRITGWNDPAHARLHDLGPIGVGFPEVIAIRGDLIYRMSDTGGAPSLTSKYRCKE